MKCAIIIAAYNAEKYILDCYNSVKNQIPLEGWEYEIRIGVDGCVKTALILEKNKIPFYYSSLNVGAYLMRNSLIYLNPADMYSYFDADDVMFPEYIKKSLLANSDAVMTLKINCNENLESTQGAVIEKGGAITFTHNALHTLGGFYNARVAADTDFMCRLGMAGMSIREISEPLYYRRKHPEALTRKPETGMGSQYRKKVWAEMTEKRNQGIIKIIPETIKLEEIKPCLIKQRLF